MRAPQRLVWGLALGLCSCSISRDGQSQVATNASGAAGSAAHGGDAGSDPSTCSAGQCDGTGLALDAYCKLEHARCPANMAQARAEACANTFAVTRQSYPNACGGESVRIGYTFGSVELYFDGAGKLSTVTTLTTSTAGPCNASFYRYGDQRCAPAGKATDIPCG